MFQVIILAMALGVIGAAYGGGKEEVKYIRGFTQKGCQILWGEEAKTEISDKIEKKSQNSPEI